MEWAKAAIGIQPAARGPHVARRAFIVGPPGILKLPEDL